MAFRQSIRQPIHLALVARACLIGKRLGLRGTVVAEDDYLEHPVLADLIAGHVNALAVVGGERKLLACKNATTVPIVSCR